MQVFVFAFTLIMGLCLDLDAAMIKESKLNVSRLKESVKSSNYL